MNFKDAWVDSITTRISVRSFEDRPLEDVDYKQLQALVNELNDDDETQAMGLVLINERNENIFKGIIGSYGKINPTPAFLIVMENTSLPYSKEKMGYYGEAFILEATSLGIGTCWVSGTFERSEVEKYVTLSNDERIHAVIAIGYPKTNGSIGTNMLSRLIGARKRKPIMQLCSNYSEDLPNFMQEAIQAAILSPSAANSQSWRFKAKDNSLTVSINSNDDNGSYSKKLDAGIAMLHAEVLLRKHGKDGNWTYLELPDIAEYKF